MKRVFRFIVEVTINGDSTPKSAKEHAVGFLMDKERSSSIVCSSVDGHSAQAKMKVVKINKHEVKK